MGFLTRLIAGLVAASTLGAGLAGTAGAVDTTGTTGDAKGVVKLASDDTTNGTVKTVADENVRYGSLVNGDFSYPSFSDIQKNEQEGYADLRTFLKSDDGTLWYNMSATDLSKYGKIGQIPGFDSSRFAWSSTENGSRVELQQDRNTKNTYAEIVAQQDNTSIYQNVSTGNGGVLYKIRLKHASRQSSHADRMQVLVGSDTAHATPVEMTRVTSNGHGDKVGGKSTTITTKVSNTDPRDHGAQWETYEGCYQVPEGQKNTVFMFKSLEGFKEDETLPGNNIGNLVDDIEFSRSYKLTYDANSSDASGQVPSDTAANTIRQTKARTTGTVHLASDDKNGLPDHLVNGDFEYPGANVLSKNRYDEKDVNWWGVSRKDKMVYDPSHETQWVSLPSTFDSDRFAWDSTEVAGTQNGSSQWHTNEVELQRDSRTGNMYGELCAYQANTSIRQYIRTTPGVLYKVRLKHASLSRDYLDKMQVLIGPDGNEQPVRMTRVESRNGLDATGESTASTTVSTHVSNEMEIKDGQGTPYSSRNHNGQWATYEGAYVATSDVTSFTFKSVDAKAYNLGNLLDDIVFDKAYRLSYDKNATDANGSVPSDETAGATKQAKSKTNGSVRLAADDDVAEYAANGLPEQLVNSDFDHDWRNIVGQSKMTDKYNFANVDPAHGDVEISGALNGKGEADASGQVPSNTTPDTTQTASSKSTGKVSDLVQRTTTHEDGSVTVKTIDTSTDVVSGCQVYYPAGQRITLATLAKDDDCWDSSMLTRPGHTQLGWNQDSQATQAQAEVTMVEGGMTVYAVWVGNPVLTYDTNKPNTWTGQMPSTPASVSVPYNTAAADGSGWQSGDTSKIRGYRFLGWYAGPQDDAGLYDWNTLLTGSVTVYAHWQRLQANVIYNANGGTGSHVNTTGWQYSDVTIPGDTSKSFKRDGYYFKYWNTQKDGKGTTYKDSAQVPLQDKNVTLYAIWAPYHTVITETGGIGLPIAIAGGVTLLVMGIGSTVMLTRRMRGER